MLDDVEGRGVPPEESSVPFQHRRRRRRRLDCPPLWLSSCPRYIAIESFDVKGVARSQRRIGGASHQRRRRPIRVHLGPRALELSLDALPDRIEALVLLARRAPIDTSSASLVRAFLRGDVRRGRGVGCRLCRRIFRHTVSVSVCATTAAVSAGDTM